MTDFGRRIAIHKTTHQDGGVDEISIASLSGQLTDNQPPKSHDMGGAKHLAATLAQLNALVSDATLDDSGSSRTPSAHKAGHQDGGVDEIALTGLVGATPTAIIGDATPGRLFRASNLAITNGTDPATLLCFLTNRWNGDNIAPTDNIAKGATTGHFTLSADGTTLIIEAAGLSGNVVFAMASKHLNQTHEPVAPNTKALSNDIQVRLPSETTGLFKDMTLLVEPGSVSLNILYITDT